MLQARRGTGREPLRLDGEGGQKQVTHYWGTELMLQRRGKLSVLVHQNCCDDWAQAAGRQQGLHPDPGATRESLDLN